MREKRIRAICPECAKEREIQRGQVGEELVCSGCGTKFCVQLEIRRHRRPRTPNSNEIEERQVGVGGSDGDPSGRGAVGLVKFSLVLVLFVLLAVNFDAVFYFVKNAWALLWPWARDSGQWAGK